MGRRVDGQNVPDLARPCALRGPSRDRNAAVMSTLKQARRHPLEHPVETACGIALGAAGQLVLTWALAKAARRAEREDLQPVV